MDLCCRVYQGIVASTRLAGERRQFQFYWEYIAIAVRRVVRRTMVSIPKEKNKTRLPEQRNDGNRYYGTQTQPCCFKDGKRKVQEGGMGREMDCEDCGWKDVKQLGKNGAIAGISRRKASLEMKRRHDDMMKSGKREWLFLLHFPKRASIQRRI